MVVYGAIGALTEKAVEVFLEREQAEAFVAEVERDEPQTVALLTVEPIEPMGSAHGPTDE